MEDWLHKSGKSFKKKALVDNFNVVAKNVYFETSFAALAVLPSRKSDQEISKSDFYQTIFLPKIRPKADPNSLF